MHDYSDALANAVRNARQRLGKTQAEVSELIEASPRTILNIENRRANPKLHILFPLVQRLNIDPMELFFPGSKRRNASKKRASHRNRQTVGGRSRSNYTGYKGLDCSCKKKKLLLRSKECRQFVVNRACPPCDNGEQALRLCVWLFAQRNMELNYINDRFPLAPGAKQRKIEHNCLPVGHRFCFLSAYGAGEIICFLGCIIVAVSGIADRMVLS